MKIGILGGSFDPVHNGHIDMASFCKEKFNLDKIMFLPLGDPPHKNNITDKVNCKFCSEHSADSKVTTPEEKGKDKRA